MNYRMLGYVLGRIFMVEAALLLPPSIVAVIHGEWSCLFAFVVTAVGLAVLGLVLGLRSPANTAIYAREGLVIVALAWVLMSVFGALPFISFQVYLTYLLVLSQAMHYQSLEITQMFTPVVRPDVLCSVSPVYRK